MEANVPPHLCSLLSFILALMMMNLLLRVRAVVADDTLHLVPPPLWNSISNFTRSFVFGRERGAAGIMKGQRKCPFILPAALQNSVSTILQF